MENDEVLMQNMQKLREGQNHWEEMFHAAECFQQKIVSTGRDPEPNRSSS